MKMLGRIPPPLRDTALWISSWALTAAATESGLLPDLASQALLIAGLIHTGCTLWMHVWVHKTRKRAHEERKVREEREFNAYIPVARSRHVRRF